MSWFKRIFGHMEEKSKRGPGFFIRMDWGEIFL